MSPNIYKDFSRNDLDQANKSSKSNKSNASGSTSQKLVKSVDISIERDNYLMVKKVKSKPLMN